MTTDSQQSIDVQPQNNIWILLYESDDNARFAIAEVLEKRTGYTDDTESMVNADSEDYYRVNILYDTVDVVDTPNEMEAVPESVFYAPLPDHDEWSERFADLLDQMLGLITPTETAEALCGEPAHQTGGRTGYEAADFWVFNGIFESITEYSVHHGHGPSRYRRAVESRVDGLPDWMIEQVLNAETERWDGGMSLDEKAASCLVELGTLREKLLDEDHSEKLETLVNEYNLPYDEYIEGQFTTHDCPHCGHELIERPVDDDGFIRLDCSNCDVAYEGYADTDNRLIVGDELGDDQQ